MLTPILTARGRTRERPCTSGVDLRKGRRHPRRKKGRWQEIERTTGLLSNQAWELVKTSQKSILKFWLKSKELVCSAAINRRCEGLESRRVTEDIAIGPGNGHTCHL